MTTYNKDIDTKEIDAAWYAVSRFIAPFDYVLRYTDREGKKNIITANPNCVLAAHISKIKILKPIALTKIMLQGHFNRETILFYKSAPNARLSSGYGRTDEQAQAISFSTDLGITTKKTIDSEYYTLLVGIDIDCHNGEKHVAEVEALIKRYLPQTYWEDSTNGNGRHGYLKIRYHNSFGVIETISNNLKLLFSKLDELKNLYGYEAKIDDPAGLPYKLEFTDTNPYDKNWSTLFHKSGKNNRFLSSFINPNSKIWTKYIYYLKDNIVPNLPYKCDENPGLLVDYLSHEDIQSSFTEFFSANNISFSPPTKNGKYYKITYQRAFKLPMFGASTNLDFNIPDIECIKEFHNIGYHTSSELKTVYNSISNDLEENKIYDIHVSSIISNHSDNSTNIDPVSDSLGSDSLSDFDTDPYSDPIPMKEETKASSTRSLCSLVPESLNDTTQNENTDIAQKISSLKKGERTIGNNCVCTNTQKLGENGRNETHNETVSHGEYAEIIDWSDLFGNKDEFDIKEFWGKYQLEKNICNNTKYEDIIEQLKKETGSMKRTALFVSAYIHKIGKIPTEDEAEEEYVSRGLNRNSDSSTTNRQKRIKGCLAYYEGNYDARKVGCKLNWSDDKQKILDEIGQSLPEILTYRQGKRIKNIKPEEIGFVYYIIRRMDDQEQDYILANSLSYSRADEYFLAEYGKKCSKHKFSGILKILLSSGLIEKYGSYKVGLRGNCYKVKVICNSAG